MKHFLRIAEGVNIAPLMAELSAHSELWDQFTVRKTGKGTPHSRMSDIWVRYNDIAPFAERSDFTGFNDLHIPVWYPAWQALPALKPILFDLMARVDGEMLGGVLITRIPPGEGIAKHTDKSWHVDYFDKFYVTLQSEPGAEFLCDDDGVCEALNPKPGEIWRFDNRKLHWVENRSAIDRITLIVCIRTDKFKECA